MVTLEERLKSDEYIERREHVGKAIDNILAMKRGPERWRASVALYLNMNPVNEYGEDAKTEYLQVIEDNKSVRAEQSNKFGTSKEGGLRFGINAPEWFMTQIEMFDRVSFDPHNPECKKNFRALCKEFGEFRIMEKI